MLSMDNTGLVPREPGVYLFKDRSGKVLYIGKAKNLHTRLSSYLTRGRDQPYKSWLMIMSAHSLDHIITATEKDALILEGNLIKKYRPRYNVKIKDDSNYPLLKLDINNQYPRLGIVRRMKNDGALYFGPFTSSSAVRATLRLIGPIFPLRKCRTKEVPKRSRPCLNYQLKRCLAPCCIEVRPEDYDEIVNQAKLFLEGRNRELIGRMKEAMQVASRDLDFERAARIRDQIRAVEKTIEGQTVVSAGMKDQDVIGLSRTGKEGRVVVLLVRGGYMVGSRNYSIHCELEHSGEALEAFLKQHYRERGYVPPEIIISDAIGDSHLISEWLTGIAGRRIAISVPSRGRKKKLVNMAVVNAENILRERQRAGQSAVLDTARSLLKLRSNPHHIECVDISNLRGNLAVASIVAFVNGLPEQSSYRNYRIKAVEGIDDYAMISEVIKRRLKKDRPPDLFVIDGGKGHLAVARKAIDAFVLESPPDVISLAKAEKATSGAADRIYLPHRKNPLMLARGHPVLSMLMRLRDETHRRAVSYHRARRARVLTLSELDRIPGVGPKRKKLLLRYLGDVKSIEKAELEDLKGVPGIDRRTAENIVNYFHGGSP
jgi:excinuclease ABC subunit C